MIPLSWEGPEEYTKEEAHKEGTGATTVKGAIYSKRNSYAQCKEFISYIDWDGYKIPAVKCIKYLTQTPWIFTYVLTCIVIVQTEV